MTRSDPRTGWTALHAVCASRWHRLDPRRYAQAPGQPESAVYAAVRADCPAELIGLLIAHGADPDLPGPDGHTAAWLAAIRGRTDLTGLLGGASGVTDAARFAGACVRGDRDAAASLLAADPGVFGRLAEDEPA